MKSPVKPRLMRILLDGKPHGEIALATGAGFTKVATIRKWIDLFGHARFIIRKREDGRTGYSCQLNCTRDVIGKLYRYPEFRALRPEIREAAWFCPLFTGNFDGLPDPLPGIIRQMVIQSHTFFTHICRYDSPEKIRETYEPVLMLNRLIGIDDPVFNDQYLYYQIFVHAVIRDIEYGGLGSGFAGLLSESQQALAQAYRNSGGCVKKSTSLRDP
ncbi:hypothetical protein [Methanoregula sp.]|uniref:hypothetical protein n=1 Tax=Methanoregula sp. TaxID=2052170 RepID=UPI003BB1B5C2